MDQSVGDLWASDASWSMWFKTSATAPAEGDFLYMVRESYSSSSQSYLAVALQPAGNVTAVLRNKAGGWATNPTWAATVVNDDQWHQLTFVREGTSLHLYIDGSLEGSLTNISGTFLSNVPVRIGSYSAGSSSPSKWFDGQIDDMRMWDRALGADEVSTLYAETTVSDSEAPVITMLGDNPMNLEPGDAFADPGATAIDNFDGAVSVVASGGENINYEYGWVQHDGQTMPNISGGTVYLTADTYAQSDGFFDNSTDWEVIAEFDNNNVNNGAFHMNLYASDWTNGQPFIVFRQQKYNAWGGNNSYFFGLWNGSSAYITSGAGPAQSSSGAMKAKKVGDVIEFYSSTDKVNFTKMGEVDMAANSYSPAQMKVVLYAGGRTVDVTGFSRSDISEGAQEGSYTITYTAQDAAGNVATAQRSVVVEVAGSGAYDWTFDGQLTNIVKFSRGFDASGNASYAYAKKEDDNTTTLYFATNLADYATFSMYNAAASSIDGSPVCMEYGPNGAVILGTDSGKVYKIELDGYSVPQSYTLLHSMVGGDRINSIGYGEASDVWLFEAGGVVHTVPNAGGGAVARHTLPAGAKIVDFAEGDSGAVAMIIRLADFSLEPRIATSDWGAVYGPSSMIAGIETGAITDFNYGRAIDTWVASSADGNTLITSSDLLQFLK